jgi:hypothetical protein
MSYYWNSEEMMKQEQNLLTFKQWHEQFTKKGLAVRMQRYSPERRSEIARHAVQARWAKHRAAAAQCIGAEGEQ